MKAKAIWLTGLPCSGKTTIAYELKKHFPKSQLLDGDLIRGTPLANTVGFSKEDREQHILRMGHLAKMFVDQGITAICSFVSPDRKVRNQVRKMFDPNEFFEVYLSTSKVECEIRDVKGMYLKARSGLIKNFTGVNAEYEPPNKKDAITLDTAPSDITPEKCAYIILEKIGRLAERQTRWHWYFGRWNGAMHLGHEHIINQSLEKYPNDKVMLAIRDVEPDEKNPWTAKEVKEMLEYRYHEEPRVEVTIVPDISSVEYGRGVGYEVNEIKVTKQIAGISGTKCRQLIEDGDPSWKNLVSPQIANFLESKYGKK